ncbi:phage minor tail protein L [Serratia aquatilis]|uniref:Phage minor tail protein L n=1 Tax=Serratia aquatilis TaxID=1737515 RepID=A0ABV6E9L1_9GAMM
MAITNDVQKLEPGDTIRLIEVDGTKFGADVLRFHNETIPHTPTEIVTSGGDESKLKPRSIWWQGKEYGAYPYEISGLASSSDGASATPKLSVANLDGVITALCLRFDDMLQAKVTIHDTFVHYLDARNFAGGNPKADPQQEFKQVFYVDSKSAEDNEAIEFTLSSPMDLQGLRIPTRQITSLCTWCMRGLYKTGDGCGYAGQNGWFDKKGKQVDDPSKDQCSGLLTDCKKRFGENSELDFGGFPGSALIRR